MKKLSTTDEFKDAIYEYLQKKTQTSLFLLLDTLTDLDNDDFIPDCLADDANIRDVKAVVTDTALRLEEIMAEGVPLVKTKTTELTAVRETLVDTANIIFRYDYAGKLIENMLFHFNRSQQISQSKDTERYEIDAPRFLSDCMAYIDDESIESGKAKKKADVIGCFPLRMARQKYNGYIKSGLTQLITNFSEGDAAELIELFKLNFYPVELKTSGICFAPFKERIEQLLHADFESFGKEEFERGWEALEDLTGELEDTRYYLEMLLEPVLYLLIILNFSLSFDFLFQENLIYKDIYFSFKENFNTENFEPIIDSFKDLLDEHLEPMLDECLTLEKRIEKYIRHTEISDEDTQVYLDIFLTINTIYDNSLTALCFPLSQGVPDGMPPADNTYVETLCDEFISFMNQAIADLPISRQKLLKQFFLNTVPCPMDDREFSEYLAYSFGEIKNDGEKMLTADTVGRIFEINGFAEWADDAFDPDFDLDVDFDYDDAHGHTHEH